MSGTPSGQLRRAPAPAVSTDSGPAVAPVRWPLESVRALAALAVLVFHAYQANRAPGTSDWPLQDTWAHHLLLASDFAVELFFVLSGFLLWTSASRSALSGIVPRWSGAQLLRRRVSRLLPLYVAVVVSVWVVNNPTLPGYWQDLVLHLTMTQVWSDQYIFWTVGPAWSLAVEFHLYVVLALSLPLVLRACAGTQDVRRRTAHLLWLPGVLVVSGSCWLVWAVFVGDRPVDSWSTWYNPLAKAPVFAIGMLVAVLVARGARLHTPRARAVAFVSGAVVAVLAVVARAHTAGSAAYLWQVVIGVGVAGLLAPIIMAPRGAVAAPWLRARPLLAIGTASYAVYLVHEPLLRLLRWTGVLPPEGAVGFIVTTALLVLVTVPVALAVSRVVDVVGTGLGGGPGVGVDYGEGAYQPRRARPYRRSQSATHTVDDWR